ncbi:MAG: type IV secretion system protein [Pseudomonadota bacterium]
MTGLTTLQDFTLVALMHEVDALLDRFIYDGYNTLSNYISPTLMVISTLFIVLMGYGIMQGWVKMSAGNFAKAMVKIIVINVFVSNWALFNEFIVNTIYAFNNGVGNAIVSAGLPINVPQTGGIDEALNFSLKDIFLLGTAFWNAASWHAWVYYLIALFIWGVGALLSVFALFEVVLSKIMLAVLLVFAPIIIPFAYFKPSSKIVDNWAGLIIAMVFLQFFVMIGLAFALCLFSWLTEATVANQHISIGAIGNWGVIALLVVSIMNVFLIRRTSRFAYALVGQGAMAYGGRVVSGVADFAMGGLGPAGKTDKRSGKRSKRR